MKKLMIGMILAGLAITNAFANGDDTGQTNNSPVMEAQPQAGNTDQNNANSNDNASGNTSDNGTASSDATQN